MFFIRLKSLVMDHHHHFKNQTPFIKTKPKQSHRRLSMTVFILIKQHHNTLNFTKKKIKNILSMSRVIVRPSCILNLQIQRVKEVDEGCFTVLIL